MDLVARLTADDKLTPVIINTRKELDGAKKDASKLDVVKEKFDKITSSGAPLARKIKEIKKQMETLVTSGENLGAEGEEMWRKLSEQAKEYDKQLRKINESTRSVEGVEADKSKGLDVKGIGGDLLDKAGLGGIGKQLGSLTALANPATIAITAVGGTMIMAGKAAAEFETHLDSLQSLTGLTDDAMKDISDGAVEMSKNFKASASDIVDAMKLIGSQAPELLADKDALMMVTEAANVLAEAAQIDVVDAAKAITGTMNQMGVSASEATNIINTFAAASQQGSADVEYLNKAFEKSGTAAKGAGMDYVELASAVEAVAPKFSSADVAGSQLASTLLKLSMSGQTDFMPSVVGMSQALENMAKAEMDDVAIKNLVGESNVTMLKSLIEARGQFDSYNVSLRNTNTAYEQMAINNDNFAGAITKLKSAWDAFLITLGQSGIISGIADNIMAVMSALGEVMNVLGDVIKAFESFGGEGTENINILKIQLDVLVKVIKGVGEVLEIIIRIAGKVFNYLKDSAKSAADWIGEKWNGLKQSLGDVAFVKVVINAFNKVMDAAASMVNAIKKYWNKLKEFLGMKVEGNVDIKANHIDDNIDNGASTTSTSTSTSTSTTSTSTSTSTSTTSTPTTTTTTPKGTKSPKAEKIDYIVAVDDNTLQMAEKKLQAFTERKKTLNIDDTEAIAECNRNIELWEAEVRKRKAILNVEAVDDGTIAFVEAKIKELKQNSLSFPVSVDNEAIRELEQRIALLKGQRAEIGVDVNSNASQIDAEIEALQTQLQQLRGNATIDIDTQRAIEENDAQIRQWEEVLQSRKIALGIIPKIEEGSLGYIQNQIEEKQKEIKLALQTDIDAESLKKLQDELDRLRQQEKDKKIELGIVTQTDNKREAVQQSQTKINQIKSDYSLNLIGKEEAEAQIAEINSSLSSLGLQEVDLHVNDDGTITTAIEDLENYVSKMDETSSTIGAMGSSFGMLGEAIGGTGGKVMEFAGQTLQATAQIIPQIVKMIAAKQAESMASGTASAASLPFPANIAAMVSIIATVASLFASIPKAFADGGIVSGSSLHGDKVLARVNSGEMILNKSQQANLFKMLKNGNGNSYGGSVEFKISGSSLKGVLNNYSKKLDRAN